MTGETDCLCLIFGFPLPDQFVPFPSHSGDITDVQAKAEQMAKDMADN